MKNTYLIKYSGYDNFEKKQHKRVACFHGTESQACTRAARYRTMLREKKLSRIKVDLLQVTDMQHIRTLS